MGLATLIKLNHFQWAVDYEKRIGSSSGFGEVFIGSKDGIDVAVKRLKITARDTSSRELTIADVLHRSDLENVVPVLDYGQDSESDRYFIVMPLCETDLEEYLVSKETVSEAEIVQISMDILNGLRSVGDIVHRDIKPENILLYRGKWCLADFGISKFVEDSTSLETLRGFLSPPYASPEQFRGERPENPSDIYSVGCVMFRMLAGAPPFSGDFPAMKELHEKRVPPDLDIGHPTLQSIIRQMLRKSPSVRPNIGRITSVLNNIPHGGDVKSVRRTLAEVSLKATQEKAEIEQAELEHKKRTDELILLQADAKDQLDDIIEFILNEIVTSAPEAIRNQREVKLRSGILKFEEVIALPIGRVEPMPRSKLEVFSFCTMSITNLDGPVPRGIIKMSFGIGPDQGLPKFHDTGHPYNWSSTLFFGRLEGSTENRWYEISFFGRSDRQRTEPYALNPTQRDFENTLGKVVNGVNIAEGPNPFDYDCLNEFADKIIERFTRAAEGSLCRPTNLPIG